MAIFGKATVASIVAPLQKMVDKLGKHMDSLEKDTVEKLKHIEELRLQVADNSAEEAKALQVFKKLKGLLEG